MQFEKFESKTPIQDFYAGQSVLITGGTGFLGKLLIEKLLRFCPELTSVYVITRRKKGQDIHTRIQHLLEEPIYNQLKCEYPQFLKKIIPIEGDIMLPNLGISSEDKNILLNNVSIVFHVAATVKFNEKLKQAVTDNVFGTKQIIDLCLSMNNLKVFMHVSTFYAHTTQTEIDEKFYNPPITGDRILKMTEVLNAEELEKLENILRKDYPNNYAFTKAIAEQLIQQYAKELPVGIFRPAIVSSTYQSPLQGWADNYFSGSNGVFTSSTTGLLRTFFGDGKKKTEIVPADLTINALIACAWDVALNKNKEDDPFVYNFISTWSNSITWEEYFNMAKKYEVPPLNSVWCHTLTTFKSYYAYYIAKTILQTVLAFFADTFFLIVGRKTWAMRIYKKLDLMVKLLSYYTLREWEGKNNRVKSLWEKLSPDDRKLFPFSMENFDWHDYMQKYMIGLRIYLLKDPLNTVPAARKRRFMFLILHTILKYTLIMLNIWAFQKLLKKYINFRIGNFYIDLVQEKLRSLLTFHSFP